MAEASNSLGEHGETDMTVEVARALTEAGYMTVSEYLAIVEKEKRTK